MKQRFADLAAFFAPLAIYLFNMVPTIHLGDAGELTVGAIMFAVPHVPGYPLLATLGHLFAQIPLGHAAWRGNLFSAFFGALAVWMTYRTLFELTANRAASLAAALAFAGTFTLWQESLKIRAYPLNTFFAALVIWLSLRWRTTRDRRFLLSAFFALGLGMANHEILLVVGTVPLALAIANRRDVHLRDLLLAITCVFLGVSVYLYVPLRAAANPVLNWGEPNTLPRLLDSLLQRQYSEKMLNADWDNKLEMLGIIGNSFLDEGGVPLLLLGLVGLGMLVRRERALLLGLLLLITVNIGLRINYIGADEMFQVRRYLISSYLVVIVGAAVATADVMRWLAGWRHIFAARVVLALFLAALVFTPLMRHAAANAQQRNWVAYEAAQNNLSHPEPAYALVVGGDNNLFPLWYLQMVERRRPTVVPLPRLGFRAAWMVNMLAPQLPPQTITMRPEYLALGLEDPLFLSAVANLVERPVLPVAFIFDRVSNPADQLALDELVKQVDVEQSGSLTWWWPKGWPAPTSAVWRYYQTTAILDSTLVRDHHTTTVATDYGAYFDRWARKLESVGDAAGATRAGLLALQADPANDVAMANLGTLLARNGKLPEAIEWYRRAIGVNPHEWRHHFNLAIILEAAGKRDEAAAEHQLAIREKRL